MPSVAESISSQPPSTYRGSRPVLKCPHIVIKPWSRLGSTISSTSFAQKSENFLASPGCPPGFRRNRLMTRRDDFMRICESQLSTGGQASFCTISALLPTQTQITSFRVGNTGGVLSGSVIGGVNDPSASGSSATPQVLERRGFFWKGLAIDGDSTLS